MKLVHPHIKSIFKFEENVINTLIIENQDLFFEFVNDIYNQTEKASGKIVLSINDKPVEMFKNVILLTEFIPFDINKKSLLTKIYSCFEKIATDENNYEQTQEIISLISKYTFSLTSDFNYTFDIKQINAQSIIKMTSPFIIDNYSNQIEKVFDYVELVREFEGEKLFVFVNLRCYFSDKDMKLFIDTINSHKQKVFFIESIERTILPYEKRITIDSDLCEF